jgi:hypothetical protein
MSQEVLFWSKSWGGKLVSILVGVVLIISFDFLPAQAQDTCQYVLGDINGDGDARPWSDINYAVAYFKGMGPPPPGECPDCACDVNCSGSFNGLDVARLLSYWKGVGDLCYFAADCPPPQPDPQGPPDGPDWGVPDTIIIGNLDLTPTLAHSGDTVEIPIWVRNDEYVGALNLAISADDAFITQWLGGTLQEPLTEWDDCGFSDPAPDQQLPGYTAQSVNGWSDIGGGDNPQLNTSGNFTQVASIRFLVSANVALTEDTTQLIPGDIERLDLSAFSDPLGAQEWPPQFLGGLLLILGPPGCEYIPGDINSTGEANGVDVQYAVNYFKGYGDPPLVVCPGCADQGEDLFGAGDVNGTCEFNGVDVQYFVNYLKGLFDPEDTLTFCPNCPPAGRK